MGGLVVLLATLWLWSPLGHWARGENLVELAHKFRGNPYAPLVTILTYAVGGLLFIPLNALVVATLVLFDPIPAFVCALAGALASAFTGYGIGKALGRGSLRRLLGPKTHELANRLDRHGTLAIAAVRLLPILPYMLVNLTCGGLGIRFSHFALGTSLGLLPGLVLLTGLKAFAVTLWPPRGTVGIILAVCLLGLAVWASFVLLSAIRRRARAIFGPVGKNSPQAA